MARSVRSKVKTGETYRFVYEIDSSIMEFFDDRLAGLLVESKIKNDDRITLYDFAMQSLKSGQTEIVLEAPANITAGFDVGSTIVMDIRIHNGSSFGHRLSRTINIQVQEGITDYVIPVANQGSFNSDFSSDFRRTIET